MDFVDREFLIFLGLSIVSVFRKSARLVDIFASFSLAWFHDSIAQMFPVVQLPSLTLERILKGDERSHRIGTIAGRLARWWSRMRNTMIMRRGRKSSCQ